VRLATPTYTAAPASSSIPKAAQGLQEENAVPREITIDTAAVESRAEAIQSHPVLASVVERLRLIDDPEFRRGGGLLSFGDDAAPLAPEEKLETAVDMLGESSRCVGSGNPA
jgi:uncharacterized protein involved in exopolysaccharide biosynthesis